jgi:hypothetical protein
MLTKVQAIFDLPRSERNAKIKVAARRYLAHFRQRIFKILGGWLNPSESRFILEFRPDSYFDYDRFSADKALLKGWLAGNRDNNCYDLGRFYAICMNTRQILDEGVPGDFVELGVYKGNSAATLAAFARRDQRHVFLFDTFEGFDKRDLHGVDSKHPVQFTNTSLSAVQKLVGTDGVTYVQGFFPESASNITMPERIAIAHIDCDLYQPMKAGLECFYPRLSPGGIMLLHDYSSGHWPGATQAIDEFFKNLPEKPILLPDKSGTAVIRKAIWPQSTSS